MPGLGLEERSTIRSPQCLWVSWSAHRCPGQAFTGAWVLPYKVPSSSTLTKPFFPRITSCRQSRERAGLCLCTAIPGLHTHPAPEHIPAPVCTLRQGYSTAQPSPFPHIQEMSPPQAPLDLQSPKEEQQLHTALPEAAAYVQLGLVRPQPVVTARALEGRTRLAGARQMVDTRDPSWAGVDSLSRVMSLFMVLGFQPGLVMACRERNSTALHGCPVGAATARSCSPVPGPAWLTLDTVFTCTGSLLEARLYSPRTTTWERGL